MAEERRHENDTYKCSIFTRLLYGNDNLDSSSLDSVLVSQGTFC